VASCMGADASSGREEFPAIVGEIIVGIEKLTNLEKLGA
jgi:hypothetical protein